MTENEAIIQRATLKLRLFAQWMAERGVDYSDEQLLDQMQKEFARCGVSPFSDRERELGLAVIDAFTLEGGEDG